jgi:hypothetical protein
LPEVLQQKTTDWHHEMLRHPGTTRPEAAARQHFDWKGLQNVVVKTCKKCTGKLPAKVAEENPWDTSQNRTTRKQGFKAMVSNYDPPGNRLVRNATAAKAADTCEKTWFTRHSRNELSLIEVQNSWQSSPEWSKMTMA